MYIAIFNPQQKEPVMNTKLYCGIDLHSSNCCLGIIDKTGKRIFWRVNIPKSLIFFNFFIFLPFYSAIYFC